MRCSRPKPTRYRQSFWLHCDNSLWKKYAILIFFRSALNGTKSTHFEKKLQSGLNLGLTEAQLG